MVAEGMSFGQYRVLRRLGGGGAGEVFLAEPTSGGTPARVVLKVLDGRADDPAAQRLAREVQMVAGLDEVHVIPYYGLAADHGTVAIIMAYAPGGSLGDNLRAGGRIALPLPPGVVARIVVQLGRALAAVHVTGLVHGDLKPNNIFVRTAPSGAPLAVVADFGQAILTQAAATLARGGTSTSEQSGWVADQLRFAAPEQLGGPAVPASDQYGLAAVAYFLLTGHAPFEGDAHAVLAAIPATPVAPPSHYNPEIPHEAERVLQRALAKQPEARFASITQFSGLLADTLAAPLGPVAGPAGVTAQMSALAAAEYEPGSPSASARGARPAAAVAVASAPDIELPGDLGAMDADLPADASPRTSRLLAAGFGATALALLITCVVTASVLWSGGNPLQLRTTLGQVIGANPTSTPSQDGGSSPEAQAAEQQLAGVTSRSPVFADTFSSNDAHWATSNSASIHDGHLYLSNPGGQTPALETTPAALQLSTLAAQVDVAVRSGSSSDLDGVCFWVSTDAKGRSSYFCYVTSSDGRYELWQYNAALAPDWQFISGAYSSALKLGIGQVNTLAVLASAKQGSASLFANGHYITHIHVNISASAAGNVGLLVLNVGTQATFTKYAVYDAS